jgi:hypothetical protein
MKILKICTVCDKHFYNSSEFIKKFSTAPEKLKYSIADYNDLCSVHRKRKKNCSVCQKLHYNQGFACSSDCAYYLKQQSWINSVGTPHNFSKESFSRKKWEDRLLQKEGIINVFQREDVKQKIKNTISEKYNNGIFIENISQTEYWKNAIAFNYIQNYGINAYLEKEFNNNTERNIYYKNVWSITISQIKAKGKEYLGYSYEEIKNYNKLCTDIKQYLTIDHRFSIIRGYTQSVSSLIIGSIHNLSIIPYSENSSKGAKCSIKLCELKHKYNTKYV